MVYRLLLPIALAVWPIRKRDMIFEKSMLHCIERGRCL